MSLMCDMLEVSRAGYYAWRERKPSARSQRQAELIDQIRQAHADSRGTYGSPRVTVELKASGVDVCENTVARYMRLAELRVTPKRRFVPRTTDPDHPHPIAPNVLDRDFSASAPNAKWASDITYIWTDEGWLYLSVVIDLFSRRVIGWSMNENLKADGVIDALSMALRRRKPRGGLLHHSDRGCQYACDVYRSMLAQHDVTCSMSRPGNCYDNAMKESFWSTLKREAIGERIFESIAEAKAAVFEYIEVFYNRIRRHSSLGYVSPETFEAALN